VDVVDARERLVGVRADDLQLDGVAVGRGDDLLGADAQPGGRGGLLGVAEVHEGPEELGGLARCLGGGFGQQRLAAVDVARGERGMADRTAFSLGSSRGSPALS
jgi:hypothetical protein